MPRTGAGGGARVLFEHANHLRRLGTKVTVVSYFPRPTWFALEADFIEVPFGRPLAASIPPCDVIVAGYWDEILPARRLGIAPVVHFEQGDFHLYDDVPDDLRPLITASIQSADWTITVGQAAEAALLERYGVIAHRISNAVDAGIFHPERRKATGRSVVFVGWDGSRLQGDRHRPPGLRRAGEQPRRRQAGVDHAERARRRADRRDARRTLAGPPRQSDARGVGLRRYLALRIVSAAAARSDGIGHARGLDCQRRHSRVRPRRRRLPSGAGRRRRRALAGDETSSRRSPAR